MQGKEGEFKAGRMGNYTITKDPTREKGLRVLMGPFTKYTKDNIEAAVGGGATAPAATATVKAKPGRGHQHGSAAEVHGQRGLRRGP